MNVLYHLLEGNEACALGAIHAGARFFAGYPITPSSEIAEVCARELPRLGGIYMQMEDEIASIAAVIGASLSGKKAFTATSGPGFSLMQENLGLGIYMEVPCVLVNVQRVGPATGLATRPAQGDVMQTRWGTHGDHTIIALSPSTVQEMYTLTVRAFNLAEKYRTPVILLADQIVSHLSENVRLFKPEELEIVNRKQPSVKPEEYLPYRPDADSIPPMAAYGQRHLLHATSTCHDERGRSNFSPAVSAALLARLHEKIEKNKTDIIQVEHFGPADGEITVIAYGIVARAVKHVVLKLAAEGLPVNLLRPLTLWPFPGEEIERALASARAVLVPEMNRGQFIGEVEKVNRKGTPLYPISRTDGELFTPEELLNPILEVVEKHAR